MFKRIIKNNKYSIISICSVALILAVWELASFLINKDYLLPRFSLVVVEFISLLSQKKFYLITRATLLRCLIGFAISVFLGIGLGVLSGIFKTFRAILAPVISFLRTAPTMALTLIIMVWLRNRYTPIMIGFIMVFPIIYRTVSDSLLNVDQKLKEMTKLYNVSAKNSIRYLYIPEVIPVLFGAMVTAFGMNIKAVISAEILAYTSDSIGLSMLIAKGDFVNGTATLFAWVLTAILLSVIFEIVLGIIQKGICKKWN